MPETADRAVVVNSTPLITLSAAHQIDLLRQLYSEVVIPEGVKKELLAGRERFGAREIKECSWIRCQALADPRRADLLLSDLDRGEAEVIVLSQELEADLVILDERLARRHAERLGLNLTGTLGVLLRAKQRGLISEIRPILRTVQAAGIWLKADLVDRTLRLAEEI